MKKELPNACDQTREWMHEVLDNGHQDLSGEAQTHLLQCQSCQTMWKALRQLETNAFLLSASDNFQGYLPDDFHNRVMNAVKLEKPPFAKQTNMPGRLSAFSYVAAVILFMLIGTWSLLHYDRFSEPDQLVENDQLTNSALSFLSFSTAKSALTTLPASNSIEDTRLKLVNTVENILSPALSAGRLIDEDFDTHLSQLMINSSGDTQY